METGLYRSMTDTRLGYEAGYDVRPANGRDESVAERAVIVRGLTRTFGSRVVLDDLDLDVAPGEIVALLGASGCGKTTLLRILAGLDGEETGDVAVPDAHAVVYQEHRLLPWRRVWQNVSIGLPRRQSRPAATRALEEVGLGNRADAWPNVLSGGEAARVALARALVRQPKLLLLDEPFASLDALTRIKMHSLVRQLWERHHPAVVMVTHDVDEAIVLADRVVVMKDGRIAYHAPVAVAHPRRRNDPVLETLRGQLMAQLGVDDAI
jgi:sulfonate transport system ATP-binding protein